MRISDLGFRISFLVRRDLELDGFQLRTFDRFSENSGFLVRTFGQLSAKAQSRSTAHGVCLPLSSFPRGACERGQREFGFEISDFLSPSPFVIFQLRTFDRFSGNSRFLVRTFGRLAAKLLEYRLQPALEFGFQSLRAGIWNWMVSNCAPSIDSWKIRGSCCAPSVGYRRLRSENDAERRDAHSHAEHGNKERRRDGRSHAERGNERQMPLRACFEREIFVRYVKELMDAVRGGRSGRQPSRPLHPTSRE